MNFITKIQEIMTSDDPGAPGFIIRAVAVVLLTAIAVRIVKVIFGRIESKRRDEHRTFGYVRIARYIVLLLIYAVAVAAVISGNIQQTVSTVLASSGIAAVVLSIACQEPIGNLCSGVILIISSPFKVGDIIRHVDLDIIGTVDEITLRHTVIRTFEQKRMFIPNSNMNKAAIENSNYGEGRVRFAMEFTITFESDLDAAIKVVTNAILRHPRFDDEKAEDDRAHGRDPVEVRVSRFEPNGVVLRVWVWAPTLSESYRMRSDILREVKTRFGYAHVRFAYPHIEMVDKNSVQTPPKPKKPEPPADADGVI